MVNSLMTTLTMNDCIVPEKAYILGCWSFQGSVFSGRGSSDCHDGFSLFMFSCCVPADVSEKVCIQKRRTSRIERDGQLIPIALHAWEDGWKDPVLVLTLYNANEI
jgi:hypothetical protein